MCERTVSDRFGGNCIRKSAIQDVSRLAEILVFTKRMNYRSIFQNDKVSFGEIQVLPLAQEYMENKQKLESIWVYDDEFVKGMLHVEDGWIHELYVDSFFQNQGIGARLIDYAIENLHAKNLMVLEKNMQPSAFTAPTAFPSPKTADLKKEPKNSS